MLAETKEKDREGGRERERHRVEFNVYLTPIMPHFSSNACCDNNAMVSKKNSEKICPSHHHHNDDYLSQTRSKLS